MEERWREERDKLIIHTLTLTLSSSGCQLKVWDTLHFLINHRNQCIICFD